MGKGNKGEANSPNPADPAAVLAEREEAVRIREEEVGTLRDSLKKDSEDLDRFHHSLKKDAEEKDQREAALAKKEADLDQRAKDLEGKLAAAKASGGNPFGSNKSDAPACAELLKMASEIVEWVNAHRAGSLEEDHALAHKRCEVLAYRVRRAFSIAAGFDAEPEPVEVASAPAAEAPAKPAGHSIPGRMPVARAINRPVTKLAGSKKG